MVEPDYDFFATRPPSGGPVPGAPVAPVRFAAMPTPGPAPMSAWNPDPVLASAPPFLAGPRAAGYAAPAPRPAAAAPARPRNVAAVAILAIVGSAVLLLTTIVGAVGVLGASSELEAVAPGMGGSLVAAALVGIALIGAAGVVLLVGGVGTLLGHRWAGWMLVATYSLYLLNSLRYLVTEGPGGASLLGLLIALALLLALVTGEGKRWLLGG